MGSKNQKEPLKNDKGVSEHAATVLTGGHGGAVPGAIVKIVKKIFSKIRD